MRVDERISLDSLRERESRRIDQIAGALRARFLTDIPGQDATYTEKLADCRAYIAAENPVLSDHPWVAAEAEAQALDATAAAQNVVTTYVQWRALGVAIEQVRLSIKRLIRDAADIDSVAAASYAGRQALAGADTAAIPATVAATIRAALMGPDAEVTL